MFNPQNPAPAPTGGQTGFMANPAPTAGTAPPVTTQIDSSAPQTQPSQVVLPQIRDIGKDKI